jgi:hypothetical protein
MFSEFNRVKGPKIPKVVSTLLPYRDEEIFRPNFYNNTHNSQNPSSPADTEPPAYADFSAFADNDRLNEITADLITPLNMTHIESRSVTLEGLDDKNGLYHVW